MEAVVEQGTLFPVIEEQSKRRSHLREMMDAIEEHGPLIPRAWLTTVLDLSRQRIKVLIDEGRIATIEIHDREMVPMASLEAFLADERKAGRPVKEFTMSERLGDAWRMYRDARKKARK